jgi:ribonucleoside-diphosphate reductase alpha chain
MWLEVIKTREWDLVNFDRTRIERVIEKAAESIWVTSFDFVDDVTDNVIKSLNLFLEKCDWETFVTIEKIQDQIERELMESGHFEVMKHFIIYRNERSKLRELEKEKVEKKLEKNIFKITKTTWKKENFDIEKIRKTYKIVSYWLARKCRFEEISDSLKKYIVEWMKTNDITKMLIKSAIDLISVENTSWQFIAWRLSLIDLYKEASNNRNMDIKKIYESKHYKALFDDYIKSWLYYKNFYDYYSPEDILEAWEYLKKEYDFDYNYTTILMYKKRYLLNPNKVVKELPQEMYMSIALFLAIPESKENRLKVAKKIYDYCATWKISLPTPTLLNSRTNFHQLSSCFKFNVDDDLRAIYHSIENMAQVSKFGGWIWVYLWNIRSKGWYIRGTKWAAGWVNPWIKVINDTAVAVNQLWARAWAISVTLDVFHRDIYSFLDLQTETWDIRNKSFDVFPAVTFPDLFMERVANDEDWTLFDPKEIVDVTWKKLQDHFWAEFEAFYKECENNSKLELKEVVKAKDLFKKYLKATVETGMPYAFFRDTVNALNPNKHAWNVYSTQLCVEICQNTSTSKFIEESIEDGKIVIKYEPGDSVVCNLASINVAKVNTPEDIKKVIPVAMRILDNVIDLNFYPIKEAERTSKRYRSVGLWFLWLAEYLAVNKLSYDSKEARDVVDKLFEKYAYRTLKSSNELAVERWTYELYEWSEWSKWIIFWRDEDWYKNNSEMSDKWLKLISAIKKDWVRFAYHLAPAPNTSTALVIWTTASILPIYKKYFVETNAIAPSVNVAPNLDEENFWYYKEYVNMNMNDVIDMVSVIYKWIDQSISFEWMVNPATVSPRELYQYYFKAHKQWIKTVYYVRSMSLDVKNCDSCSG